MSISIPPEPKDIKELIREIRLRTKSGSTTDDIDNDAFAVWYLNMLPSYLWNQWKNYLEDLGYTWQRFLKVVKLHTNDIISWSLDDSLSWSELVERILKTLIRYSRLKRR